MKNLKSTSAIKLISCTDKTIDNFLTLYRAYSEIFLQKYKRSCLCHIMSILVQDNACYELCLNRCHYSFPQMFTFPQKNLYQKLNSAQDNKSPTVTPKKLEAAMSKISIIQEHVLLCNISWMEFSIGQQN